jgi:hypothetical protein
MTPCGVVIRTEVSTVKTSGRATQGVILMGVSGTDSVVAVATTNGKKSDDLDEEDLDEEMIVEDGEGRDNLDGEGVEVPVTAQAIREGADDSAEDIELQADSDIEEIDPNE